MEPKSREQLVKDVRGIIQFALTVAIFFESFLVTFSPGNENALLWGLAVAFYIADYLLIVLVGTELSERWALWVKGSLYVGVATFMIPIALISVFANKPFSTRYAWTLTYPLGGTLAMPILTFVLIVAMISHLDYKGAREIYWWLKNRNSWTSHVRIVRSK